MLQKKIPFSPPRIDQATVDEVIAALKSGWITTGPRTKTLEKKVEALSHLPKVLCVNSCTAGLELFMRWWGVRPGDEVIVPAYTYCATANVVVHCGATPVMVDVKEDDFTLDVEAVRQAISPKTKAIIPVDLGGMPCDYAALKELVNEAEFVEQFEAANDRQAQLGRIIIVTDAAHSLGARYRQKPAAMWPDALSFSFHAVKNMTTAEGGAIGLNLPAAFDAAEIYKALNTMSLHGQNKDALAKFGANSWEYDVVEPGFKCNMPDVLAAIGLVEIDRYESDTLPKRAAAVQYYHDLLADYPQIKRPIHQTEAKTSSYHLYLIRLLGASIEQRNKVIQEVLGEGVAVNVHYKPLPALTAYAKRGYVLDDYPVSKKAWETVISLPLFYDLHQTQQERVVDVLVKACKNQGVL